MTSWLQITWPSSVRKVSYVLIAPPVAYVATNGTPAAPYMSWATAAASVQDAVNVGGYSSNAQTLVRIGNGAHGSGVQISIAKPITLRSENGPEHTFVQATGSERVMNLSDSRIRIEGLAIQNCNQGNAYYNGGGIYMTAGTVTNCVLHNNRVGGRGDIVHVRRKLPPEALPEHELFPEFLGGFSVDVIEATYGLETLE